MTACACVRHGSNTALPMPASAPAPQSGLSEGWEPGPGMQHLHMDGFGWSLPSAEEAAGYGLPWPHDSFKLFVNVATSDIGPANGERSLESHICSFIGS